MVNLCYLNQSLTEHTYFIVIIQLPAQFRGQTEGGSEHQQLIN